MNWGTDTDLSDKDNVTTAPLSRYNRLTHATVDGTPNKKWPPYYGSHFTGAPAPCYLEVLSLKLEVSLIMTAHWALLRGLLTNYNVTALQALPNGIAIAAEYQAALNVG